MRMRLSKEACGLTSFFLTLFFVCLGLLMIACPATSGDVSPAVRKLIVGSGLYLDDQLTGSSGSTVQFGLDINNALNDIESFGLDIVFDPNILEPKKLNSGDPNSEAIEFARGTFFEDPNWYFDVSYKAGNNYIRVGGFTAYKKLLQGATCSMVILNFKILKSFGTTDLIITKLVDDIEVWPVNDGMLYASYYYDGDGDGYGDPNDSIDLVVLHPGYVTESGDCDDADPNSYPGALEVCDGKDNNCDGIVDNEGAQGCTTYYLDHDGDTYGLDGDWRCLCTPEGEYTALQAGDCDDMDPNSYPGAIEVCDGKDNDCDLIVDEEGAQDCTTYYLDHDGDTYGVDGDMRCLCSPEGEYTATQAGDCDDMDPNSYPGAIEVCDGKDNDCDLIVDEEGAQGCTTYYLDHDGDTYGVDGDMRCLCSPEGEYTATQAGDCDDTVATCTIDCTTLKYEDFDGDGYGDPNVSHRACDAPANYVDDNTDCDDNDPDRYPGNQEICDGKDNDCDGIADNEGAQGCTRYYLDEDNDGYGLADNSRCLCDPNGHYTAIKPGDCDDSDPNIHPGASDPCGDGVDQNCDGIDECAFLTGLIKDPNQPALNMIQEGVILDIYLMRPAETLIATIDDPNMLEQDTVSKEYSYFIDGLNPGIYEMRANNIDPNDPDTWKYQPMKKTVTLVPGENVKDIFLVSIPGTETPRTIKVTVNTAADNVHLSLKKLVMEQGEEKEEHVDVIELSKADPNQPFRHDFVVFQDTNYCIYAQSKGYRGVSLRFPVGQDTTNVSLIIDKPSQYSMSIIKTDIDDGQMALNFFYRDPTGAQGEWIDANNNFVKHLALKFFDTNDDTDGDGEPDDPNMPPSGVYVTHADPNMEAIEDPEDFNKTTSLRYIVDAAANHMSFGVPGDPNSYLVAFLMELGDPNNQTLLGPVYRQFKIEQVLPSKEQRSIAEVADTLVGAEIFSKGDIPIKGDMQVQGETRRVDVYFGASEIDPTFLIQVDPNGKGEKAVDPDSTLELSLEYLPDKDDPDVTVVRFEIMDPNGNPVEYNPDRDPDAPAITLDIPIANALQPPMEFSDAVKKAVIKFERFGRTEIFVPEDGENIEFYISSEGIYMARVITKHTSDWSTAIGPDTPSNFSVTVEDAALGSGEVKITWDPNSNKGLDIKCNRIYYSTSPDIDIGTTAFERVDAGTNQYITGSYIIGGLTDQQIYYFSVVAEDQLGNLSVSDTTDKPWAIPGVKYTSDTVHSTGDVVDITDYRIITFPVIPFENDLGYPNNILDDLGEINHEEWRLFWWNPNVPDAGKYYEFPDGNIVPCKAYFLITKIEGVEIDIPGRPVQTPYAFVIREDWNLIGSPYPFDVSWQEILDDPNNATIIMDLYCGDPNNPGVPTLYAFDPNAPDPNRPYRYEIDVMEAGVGYWLRNDGQSAPLHFKPNPYISSVEIPRYRPVAFGAEAPPALPVSPEEGVSEDEVKGGCFVSLFGKDGLLAPAIFSLLLLLAGILAITAAGIRIIFRLRSGKGIGAGPLTIFLVCLGLSFLVFGGLAEAGGKTPTYLEAREAFKSGEYEKAEAGFRRVLAVYPKHAYAQKDLGLSLIFLKRPDDAMDALKKAAKLAPKTKFSLEALNALGILEIKKQGHFKQSLLMKYVYDDNVTLFPVIEEDPAGKSDSYYSFRYLPKLIWPFPAMRGLNLFFLQYMYDTRFYNHEEEKDLQVQMLTASWTYFRGTSRIGLLANYSDITRNHDHYGYGHDIKLKWTYDIDFCMRFELTGGYGRRIHVFDRTTDKDYINGDAKLRFYSPNRAGYIELIYSVTAEDLIRDGLTLAEKEETTVGDIEKCSFRFSIPKSFILPLDLLFPKEDWSSYKDTHTLSLRKKKYEFYKLGDLDGRRREDRTFTYRFKHKQGLFEKKKNGRKYLVIDLILEYMYKQNDSNIKDITAALDSKDYHRNVYSIGLAFKF